MAHPLDGVREKIHRAEEHIKRLEWETQSFLRSDPPPYEIVGEHQKDARTYVFVVKKVPVIPLRFAIIVGDAVHNMRSSLDHIVYALVVKNGGTPTTQTQFPICKSVGKFRQAVQRGRIKGVSSAAADLIHTAQPYNSATPDDTFLAALDELSVIDKHRLPVMVAAAVHLGHQVVFTDQPGFSRRKSDVVTNKFIDHRTQPWAITREGQELFSIGFEEPAPHVKVDVDFTVHIAFEKVGRAKGEPVARVLRQMLSAAQAAMRLFGPHF